MDTEFSFVDGMFKTNTGLVMKATEGIPSEQWLLKPGESSNHLMWMMGHLIWSRGNILRTLGTDWKLSWAKQFARGMEPEEIREYPKAEEVRRVWGDLAERLSACLSSTPAEVMAKPHDKPTFDGKVSGFVAFLAFHETYHVGQVSYLRKWLGHDALVG